MTNPIILTPEDQAIADNIYARIEQYQQDHYQPATGWPKTALAFDVRQSLDKADSSAQTGHTHTTEEITDLQDTLDTALAGKADTGHRHGLSDLDGTSSLPTASTLVLRGADGGFDVIDPTRSAQPANRRFVEAEVGKKANVSHNHAINQVLGLQGVLDSKSATGHSHAIDDITGLREALSTSGGGTIDPEVLLTKADLISGTVPLSQLPTLPASKVTDLSQELAARPKTVDGKLPKAVLPTTTTADIPGLDAFIAGQANNLKLVGGLVPVDKLPGAAFNKAIRVSTVDEMLTLTTSQANSGDVAVVSSGTGAGTYQLAGDPGVLSSWIKYTSAAAVNSVNGKVGAVTLTASDVGARPAGDIAISDVTDLTVQLGNKLEQSDLEGLPTPAEMDTLRSSIPNQNYSYLPVDYVATTRLVSLSGQQSVDGELMSAGKRVLLTNQSSSSQNGIWVTSSTSWYRDTSMPANSIIPKGALVTVTSGVDNANTLWQMRNSTSAKAGVDSQNWHKILTAGGGGIDFTVGNGLQLVNNILSAKAGSNITITESGISLDTTGLMRKAAGVVPAGSAVATVTHNLGTRDIYVAVYENGTGDQVLVGVTITGVNTAAIEFATAPAVGAYRYVCFG